MLKLTIPWQCLRSKISETITDDFSPVDPNSMLLEFYVLGLLRVDCDEQVGVLHFVQLVQADRTLLLATSPANSWNCQSFLLPGEDFSPSHYSLPTPCVGGWGWKGWVMRPLSSERYTNWFCQEETPLLVKAQICWLEGLWNGHIGTEVCFPLLLAPTTWHHILQGIDGPSILLHPILLHKTLSTWSVTCYLYHIST